MRRHEAGAAADPVRREYARLAARYDRHWARYVAATVDETRARIDLAPDGRLLDVGCGTGALLAALAGAAPEALLVGLDTSPEMLAVARARLGPTVGLCRGGAEALPFADGAFDCVASMSILHYLRRPEAALAEMVRVLRPGGRLVVTAWSTDHPPLRALDLWLRLTSPAYARAFGAAELVRLMRQAGAAELSVAPFRIGWLWGLATAVGRRT